MDATELEHWLRGHAVAYRGEPCWVVRDVGTALGYTDGGRSLAAVIRRCWRSELVEGTHVHHAQGDALLQARGAAPIAMRQRLVGPSVTLLTRAGLLLVCELSHKPARASLREAVQAAVERSQGAPRAAAGAGVDRATERARRLALDRAREDRLRRLAIARGYDRAARTLRRSGAADEAALVTLELCAAEALAGRSFGELTPTAEDSRGWVRASVIGLQLGISRNRVGRIAIALGLRGNQAGLTRVVVEKVNGGKKLVANHVYSPAAVKLIADEYRRLVSGPEAA